MNIYRSIYIYEQMSYLYGVLNRVFGFGEAVHVHHGGLSQIGETTGQGVCTHTRRGIGVSASDIHFVCRYIQGLLYCTWGKPLSSQIDTELMLQMHGSLHHVPRKSMAVAGRFMMRCCTGTWS